MKIIKRILFSILGLLVLLVIGFSIWAYTPAKPMQIALDSVKSAEVLNLGSASALVFKPLGDNATTGLIFYPGGRVDYRAYAPMAENLAKNGFLVIIPKMPFNLAVFGFNQAEKYIQEYPAVVNWVIGGHSLGGSMAAHYVFENQQADYGLLLVASYPAQNDNLQEYTGSVYSIYATLDGLATVEDIQNSRALLPVSTTFIEIVSGNHAQFSWYGEQPGDNDALISREIQQQYLVDYISKMLESE
jgi:dienelactone hydrolase